MTRCWHVGQTDSGSRSNHRAMLRKALRQGGPLHAAEAMLQAAIRLLRPQRPMGLSSFGDAFLARLLLCPLRLTHTPLNGGEPRRGIASGRPGPREVCRPHPGGLPAAGARQPASSGGSRRPKAAGNQRAELPLSGSLAPPEHSAWSRLAISGAARRLTPPGGLAGPARAAWPGGHAAALPGASCQPLLPSWGGRGGLAEAL